MILAYRGDDLELKTPRAGRHDARDTRLVEIAAPSGPEWLSSALIEAEADGEEVWVDSTVLKCCNQAFELALAHRSSEVRLEHLVHAMTVVPDAVGALRDLGVSDATLRRESGIIIAHDIPTVTAHGHFAPATSDDMEDVLRHAAGRAYEHRSPVTIDDILQTLFDMTRDNPTRSLLSRHRSEWSLREPADPPPRRYSPEPRERVRAPSSARYEDTHVNLDVPTVTDSYQNSRIDTLERAVRELTEALTKREQPTAPEPEAPARSELGGHANGRAQAQLPDELMGRLSDIEASVDRRFRELARTWNVLGDRLQTVEDMLLDDEGEQRTIGNDPAFKELTAGLNRLRGLDTLAARLERIEGVIENLGRSDPSSAVEQKIADVDETFKRVLQRLDGLDRRLDSQSENSVDLTPIRERLDDLSRKAGERPNLHAELAPMHHKIDQLSRLASERPGGPVEADLTPLNSRLDLLERLVRDTASGDVDLAPVSERLDRLERTITERSASGIDYGPIMDRFKDVESRISDANLLAESLGDRIDAFDSNVDAYRAQVTQTSTALGNEIKAVASAVSAQHAAGERLYSLVSAMPAGPVDFDMGEMVSAVSDRLQGPLSDVRKVVEADRQEQREQFEYLVNGLGKSAEDHRQDLTEVHEAMLKLNGNQQTLAQSMDRWRLDVSGDIGVLSSRLEQLESRVTSVTAAMPTQDDGRVEELRTRLDQVSRVIERKEERRSGFLMWLFGTEDWWSDGWRTPEEREAAHGSRQDAQIYPVDQSNTKTPVLRPEERRLHG